MQIPDKMTENLGKGFGDLGTIGFDLATEMEEVLPGTEAPTAPDLAKVSVVISYSEARNHPPIEATFFCNLGPEDTREVLNGMAAVCFSKAKQQRRKND